MSDTQYNAVNIFVSAYTVETEKQIQIYCYDIMWISIPMHILRDTINENNSININPFGSEPSFIYVIYKFSF